MKQTLKNKQLVSKFNMIHSFDNNSGPKGKQWPAINNKNTTMKYIILILGISFCILFTSCETESPANRETLSFNREWKFTQNDSTVFKGQTCNDSDWRLLNLPHDWSIEGKFDKNNPAGIGGGALPGGVGWYRKSFEVAKADSQKRHYIKFDGVYQNSEVYLNGHLLGKRPNGYITFQYDLTPYINFGETNTLAVRVDNSDQPNSRWYSGSGIYRNVWLIKTHPVHITLWGTHITTPNVSDKGADVKIAITVNNTLNSTENLMVKTKIVDHSGKTVSEKQSSVSINQNEIQKINQQLKIDRPVLWSIENPYLYKAINYLIIDDEIVDEYETSFGVRYFNFDEKKGFSLNGKPVKIKGVCNHHDLGALGAALNIRAKERQLEILKEMGCNGIRTAHNPPSPELLDLCDRMGFIVQNETFDVWAKKKVKNDYAKYWDEWHVKDLTDHLLRDRNHPSVFSWSIGNEILEQWDSTGIEIAKELAGIVKKYAPNMPVTSGLNHPYPDNFIIKSGALDLIGYNYHHEDFESFPEVFEGERFIATETTSSLQTRGVYNMPSDSIFIWPKRWDIPFYEGNPDNTCSAYDNCHAPWGSTHEASWKLIKKHDYLSGLYIWTGFDYIGEPTPYQWPSRSSYFGIVDLAGFPKDVYYLYQSEWTEKPVLHIFPHWNWEEGKQIDIWAYTNFEEVELFINNESQGIRKKTDDKLHLQWRLNYTAGTLKAIGKNKDGSQKEVTIKTAGEPYAIRLTADRSKIKADGADLSFITAEIVDGNGNYVPNANNKIFFDMPDNVTIAGVDNGSQTSHEPFQANSRKAFNGKCLLIVKAGFEKGLAKIKASSKGLKNAQIEISIH